MGGKAVKEEGGTAEATEQPKKKRKRANSDGQANEEAPVEPAEPAEKPVPAPQPTAGYFSDQKFADLAICDQLKKALAEAGFEKCTEIQAKSVVPLLAGKDVL